MWVITCGFPFRRSGISVLGGELGTGPPLDRKQHWTVEGELLEVDFQGSFSLGHVSGGAEGGLYIHFATAEDGLQLHYWRETFLTPPAPSVPDVSEGLHRIKRSASAVPTRTIRISQEPRNVHHHPRNHATGGPAAGWDGPPKGFIGRRAANCRRRNAAGMP